MKTVFKMVGKYCTRCKGSIYTAWRTLDDHTYYHPHCFTCAICGEILECAKNRGLPNLKEIYCRSCYSQYFCGGTDMSSQCDQTAHVPLASSRTIVHCDSGDASKAALEYKKGKNMQIANANILSLDKHLISYATTSESHCKVSGGDQATKTGISKTDASTCNSNLLERKASRIPRPTSAISKKSLSDTSASAGVGLLTTSRDGPLKIPQKIRRSLSLIQNQSQLMQEKTIDVNIKSGYCLSNTAGKSSSTRPKSSVSLDAPDSKVSTSTLSSSVAKRQCAASFCIATERKRIMNDCETQTSPLPNQSVSGLISIPDTGSKRGIPSSNLDILNVIKAESSQNFCSILHKRSFKITFDCPICMGSLVHGISTTANEGRPGGNVTTVCGHLFHRECMEHWLKARGNKRCPICSALCLPETIQPVYLECNVTAEDEYNLPLNSKSTGDTDKDLNSYKTLRTEYKLLKAMYDEILTQNESNSLKAAIASSLQSAYDMECRNRLQLQWENKKLMRQMEDLQKSAKIN